MATQFSDADPSVRSSSSESIERSMSHSSTPDGQTDGGANAMVPQRVAGESLLIGRVDQGITSGISRVRIATRRSPRPGSSKGARSFPADDS
ncbi:MAG: hypothetical protein IPI27_18345 [Betaproteobacteria bacterium]|nr:hypothetical protein [Betaproteobacteria bacterium]